MQLRAAPSATLGRLASRKPHRPSMTGGAQHYAAAELRYLTCGKPNAGVSAPTAGSAGTSAGRPVAAAAASNLCPARAAAAPLPACSRVGTSLPRSVPPVTSRMGHPARRTAAPPPPPRSHSAAPAAPEIDLARIFPAGVYSVEMQVRDYELDQFSVVNNAVYSSFFQHARHEAFAALGHEVDDYARAGTPLALSELNIKFRAPLRSRDVFRVSVWVQKVTGARVVFQQRITKRQHPRPPQAQQTAEQDRSQGPAAAEEEQEELIAEAEAVVVFLDSLYRPSRIPREAARCFQQLADMRTAAAAAAAAAGAV